jgi:SAM-dependent methyltransferase
LLLIRLGGRLVESRVFKNLARMALGPLQERGLLEMVRSIRGCLSARERERCEGFDRRFGTDTEQHLSLESLRAEGADVPALWRYWPTLEAPFQRMLKAIDLPANDFVFVDLGSGKGRVLLMAAEHPFRRIVGVELSPALHRIAEANLRRFRSPTQRCFAFDLQCLDAATFVPPPENLLVYLFQPFPSATLDTVLANLRGAKRRVLIAYMNPLFHEQVLASGFALQASGPAAGLGEFRWTVYRNPG